VFWQLEGLKTSDCPADVVSVLCVEDDSFQRETLKVCGKKQTALKGVLCVEASSFCTHPAAHSGSSTRQTRKASTPCIP